jgi:hypothetical protein
MVAPTHAALLSSLICADDLVIIAQNALGLQFISKRLHATYFNGALLMLPRENLALVLNYRKLKYLHA